MLILDETGWFRRYGGIIYIFLLHKKWNNPNYFLELQLWIIMTVQIFLLCFLRIAAGEYCGATRLVRSSK